MKVEWGCNFVLCSIKYADRDVAEAYEVSVVSGVTPRFRIGLGMAA